MKKAVIGIVPLIDENKDSLWMLPGYMDGIEQAGGLPVMLPLTTDEAAIKQLVRICDGILFTGGHDVSPELYGEAVLPECGECSEVRDQMECLLLREVLSADMPVLGICRGIQFINAALGGSLYQDIPTQQPSELEHHQLPPYDKPIHEVRIMPYTPLAELLGRKVIAVNSYHHQAIKQLSECLEIMAEASDGIIEAVCMPEKSFVWAMQWHPEFSCKADENSQRIFRAFVGAAEQRIS